ncbi:MAG: calcium-binding protein [Sporolactobacillus sp.]
MVSAKTLKLYFNDLKKRIIFPFTGQYEKETGRLFEDLIEVQVLDVDKRIDDFYGIICLIKIGRKTGYVPLADIEPRSDDANFALIDDYKTWFWNYR